MKNLSYIFLLLISFSCKKEDDNILQESILADYIQLHSDLEIADLIACAGGNADGLFNNAAIPTSIFFYPIAGATDFRYFEAENVADSLDFSKYIGKDLISEPIFNGYLWKFNNTVFEGERMGIVTYKTPGKLHVCNPIRQKTNIKPTEVNEALVTVTENEVSPSFSWKDGMIDENVIYFQIISDMKGNLISGTYTIEKRFTFYDLDNVVLNITNPSTTPTLFPNTSYRFTMMAVSEDNWVNLFFEKMFTTN